MAVQPWEFENQPEPKTRPGLRLVSPPPAGPRPVLAVALVVLIAGMLGLPVLKASVAQEVSEPAGSRPSLPTRIEALDPIRAMPLAQLPSSERPVGGMTFVSCTRLWTAQPEGTDRRLVVDMAGISSPTFSPDARSIAFFADGPRGQDLWIAAADGSELENLGPISTDGLKPHARATGLTWSPNRKRLAFALRSNYYDAWSGGSVVWTLDLKSGEFSKEASGYPAAFWMDRSLVVARYDALHGSRLDPVGHGRISDAVGGLSGAQVQHDQWWFPDKHAVVLRADRNGDVHLAFGKSFAKLTGGVLDPPSGHTFAPETRPGISQDGTRLVVELRDRNGGRDLGTYDVLTESWTVLDYAWEPDVSPLPSSFGPVDKRRAVALSQIILSQWGWRPKLVSAVMIDPGDAKLFPIGLDAWITEPARKTRAGWSVDAVFHGAEEGTFSHRRIRFEVFPSEGRLVTDLQPMEPLGSTRTIEGAVDVVRAEIGPSVVAPAGLPAGSRLAARYPVSMWSWRGSTTATLGLRVPMSGGGGSNRFARVSYYYGDEISLALGCGGANDPKPVDVAGEPGVIDHSGATRQVMWPATVKRQGTATLSISGEMARPRLMRLARALEGSR